MAQASVGARLPSRTVSALRESGGQSHELRGRAVRRSITRQNCGSDERTSAACCSAAARAAWGHDIITTPITFDREILRIVDSRCASCHHPGGPAFSLLTYKDARPWAEAIKEEVLARRMPPWGAVKGFGDFRNDQALTPEQLELIVSWADGGVPEGEEKDLPPRAQVRTTPRRPRRPKARSGVSGDFTVKSGSHWTAYGRSNVPEQRVLPDHGAAPGREPGAAAVDSGIQDRSGAIPFCCAPRWICRRAPMIQGVPQGGGRRAAASVSGDTALPATTSTH